MLAMYAVARCSTRLSQNARAYCCFVTTPSISSVFPLTCRTSSLTYELWSPALSMVLQLVFFISRQTPSQSSSTRCTKASTAALATPRKASDWDERSTLGMRSSSILFLMLSSS